MSANTLILVEGIDDVRFLEAYLKHLGFSDGQFAVEKVDGKDNTEELRDKSESAIDRNHKVLVIFDANSNPAKARENILEALQGLSYNDFLFPDNRSNGTLENLLEQIINSQHKAIFDCFEKYKMCISRSDYNPPSMKAKIYAYQWSHGLRKEERDRGNRHFDPNYWNFDSAALGPLKSFLTEHLA